MTAITVITPTADRPVAFELAESMMRRQTLQPDEWIVADGGQTPAACSMDQVHVHEPRPAGAANFANNLLNGIARANGELVIIVEDDDWYSPTHLERMADLAQASPKALIFGAGDKQHYHNVAARCWRIFENVGASLCQTGFRRSIMRSFRSIVQNCLARGTYGIDTTLWRATPREHWALGGELTVLGIKGLPGRPGLGVGHRPGDGWTADPDLSMLRAWIGGDADTYSEFKLPRAA